MISIFFVNVLVLLLTSSLADPSPPTAFIKDYDSYMKVCQRLTCKERKAPFAEIIAFHANFKNHLNNVPANTVIKFDNVQLNKGKGYDPKTGIFTAPVDGLYSLDWLFVSLKGGTVYPYLMVDGKERVRTCIVNQQADYISTTGHFVTELKKGNRVWIKNHVKAKFINGGLFNYFSGYKIN
ncbi:complement C1q tumor necrosis factor-related protein 3-like [Saccostrea cucullata]|uniref:complement C1q tumor necrosis factor-related protein 3-like n=1 Tax=Saccostrea cuccullata TaxID=36930 RepID=UPI002ED17557